MDSFSKCFAKEGLELVLPVFVHSLAPGYQSFFFALFNYLDFLFLSDIL